MRRWDAGAAGLVTAIVAVWLTAGLGTDFVTTAVDDLSATLAAAVATWCCLRRAHRSERGARRPWALVGAGAGL